MKLAALGVVLACATAHADEPTWHAPPECPDAAALRAAIERRLDESLDRVVLAIDVEVAHEAAGYVAHVTTHGALDDTRTLTSASCGELVDAVAIVIARLATEARRAAHPPPPPPPPPPAPPQPRHVQIWHAGARISGVVGTGAEPDLAAAGEVAGWVTWRTLALELAGTRWATRTARLEPDASSGVDVQLDALVVRAGWRPAASPLRAWAVAEIGALHGAGIALASMRPGSARWLGAGAGFGVVSPAWRNARLAAGLDLIVPFDRVRFSLDSGTVIYETAPVAARIGAGLEIGWP